MCVTIKVYKNIAISVLIDKTRVKMGTEVPIWIFCFLVFLPQRADQAASAYVSSFADTCFASSTGLPQSYGFRITVLSTLLLFALSKPVTPIKSILGRIMCVHNLV